MTKNALGADVAKQKKASNALLRAEIREATLVVIRDDSGNLTKEGGKNLVEQELLRLATFLGVSRGTGALRRSKAELLIAVQAKWAGELERLSLSSRIELAPKTEKGTHGKAWNAR